MPAKLRCYILVDAGSRYLHLFWPMHGPLYPHRSTADTLKNGLAGRYARFYTSLDCKIGKFRILISFVHTETVPLVETTQRVHVTQVEPPTSLHSRPSYANPALSVSQPVHPPQSEYPDSVCTSHSRAPPPANHGKAMFLPPPNPTPF